MIKLYWLMNKHNDIAELMMSSGLFICLLLWGFFPTIYLTFAGVVFAGVRFLWIVVRACLCSKFDETDEERLEREDHLYC